MTPNQRKAVASINEKLNALYGAGRQTTSEGAVKKLSDYIGGLSKADKEAIAKQNASNNPVVKKQKVGGSRTTRSDNPVINALNSKAGNNALGDLFKANKSAFADNVAKIKDQKTLDRLSRVLSGYDAGTFGTTPEKKPEGNMDKEIVNGVDVTNFSEYNKQKMYDLANSELTDKLQGDAVITDKNGNRKIDYQKRSRQDFANQMLENYRRNAGLPSKSKLIDLAKKNGVSEDYMPSNPFGKSYDPTNDIKIEGGSQALEDTSLEVMPVGKLATSLGVGSKVDRALAEKALKQAKIDGVARDLIEQLDKISNKTVSKLYTKAQKNRDLNKIKKALESRVNVDFGNKSTRLDDILNSKQLNTDELIYNR
jgi:hypothetical protein